MYAKQTFASSPVSIIIYVNGGIIPSQTTVPTFDCAFNGFDYSTARKSTDRHHELWSNMMSDSSGDVHESEDEHIGGKKLLSRPCR